MCREVEAFENFPKVRSGATSLLVTQQTYISILVRLGIKKDIANTVPFNSGICVSLPALIIKDTEGICSTVL